MRAGEADILCVPGLSPFSDDHWLKRWEGRLSTARLVGAPEPSDHARWTQAIRDAVAQAQRPVVLVAHSLGVLAAAHALEQAEPGRVRGGFFVSAPSQRGLQALPHVDPAFAPPLGPLPFPSLLVASRDDPHATYEEMEAMALDWGSQIVDAGAVGHIDAASGHGPWPEGLMRFGAFLSRL
ncbi:MAG: alpha/beta hydrolase [Hyphomicrobiales bacterium]|nr:alpha/beta hydrolase [Hyphomicrobiales bacterium]